MNGLREVELYWRWTWHLFPEKSLTTYTPDYRYYYGLASFRWFNSPSFMFGGPGASDQGDEGDNA